jgi:tyrosyl-tRNA synthetase
VNVERVDEVDRKLTAEDLRDGQILLRAGRKRYHRVIVS